LLKIQSLLRTHKPMQYKRPWTLATYLAALPVATIFAVFIYFQHPQVTSATSLYAPLPMLLTLWLTHISCILFLVFHPSPYNENQLSVALISLFISATLGIFLIFALRVHYSLSLLITYHGISGAWTVWVHNRTVRRAGNSRFSIARSGRWRLLEGDNSTRIQFIEEPAQFRKAPGEILVVDVSAGDWEKWSTLTSEILSSGDEVMTLNQFYELTTGRLLLPSSPAQLMEYLSRKSWYLFFKRLSDLIISGMLLVITSPIVIACMILIRLGSAGSPLYAQTRVGRYGKTFRLYKLRTMRTGAEKYGPQFTSQEDPRITKFGHFLRRTKVDEWPQFYNVLVGHMSLVGPRPERPEWVSRFQAELPDYELRHTIRPGITGWAQITEGYARTLSDTNIKLQRDLFYVRYLSLSLDLAIVFRTIPVIGKGFTPGAAQ